MTSPSPVKRKQKRAVEEWYASNAARNYSPHLQLQKAIRHGVPIVETPMQLGGAKMDFNEAKSIIDAYSAQHVEKNRRKMKALFDSLDKLDEQTRKQITEYANSHPDVLVQKWTARRISVHINIPAPPSPPLPPTTEEPPAPSNDTTTEAPDEHPTKNVNKKARRKKHH
jgi:hypothetical protein